MIRIGHGYDCHAFDSGDHLIIGGVKIPFHKGIRSHSDGDVLYHAVCDALLGAFALGDLGQHFPDTNPKYKNISSDKLLRQVWTMVNEKKYQIQNLDSTLITEQPKLSPHILQMRKNLAEILNLSVENISVKAKTNEKMDSIGKGEGIAAHVVVIVSPF